MLANMLRVGCKRGIVAAGVFLATVGLAAVSNPTVAHAQRSDATGGAPNATAKTVETVKTVWHPLRTLASQGNLLPQRTLAHHRNLLPPGNSTAFSTSATPVTPVTPGLEGGATQAGQMPDFHPTTVQIQVGPPVGVVNFCSGTWVAPDKLLTARHCFEKYPAGPVRVYSHNSALGAPPIANGVTWATPGGKTDIAMVITRGDTSHPVATISTSVLPPSTPLHICGQNFIVKQSENINVDSVIVGGKDNFCANVTSLSAAEQSQWEIPLGGEIIPTVPLSIEHGDSGGPLYNQYGQLVGVTSTKANYERPRRSQTEPEEKITFNTSISLRAFAPWLEQFGIKVAAGSSLPPKNLPANLMRVAGKDRLDTASLVAAAIPGAQTLLVTTGLNAADGLAATQLSAVGSTALVLSNSRSSLDAEAVKAITTYGFKRVVRVGGTVGFSSADRRLIANRGMELVELVGTDRFDTAVKVAQYRDQLAGKPPAHVMLADGINFPDALAAGAAAGLSDAALVLSAGDSLPAASSEYLSANPAVPLVVVGGPADRARQAAGLSSEHVFVGADRYNTATLLAQSLLSEGKVSGVVLVSGRDFPDALAAGAYTVKQGSILLLVPPAGTKNGFLQGLWNLAGQHGVIIGGSAAVSDQDVAYALQP